MRMLLVEDDVALGGAVRDQAVADGHSVDWAKGIGEAEEATVAAPYELVLLDLMLPDGRGLDFLKRRRTAGDATPVIVLTARDQISDRIAALDAGADDYLVKPFDLFELSARIRAVGRRYAGNPNPLVVLGDLEIDLAQRSIRRAGKAVQLTRREWSLFEAFVQRPQQLMSKSDLEERLYAFDAEVESNTIEVYIGRIRRKLGSDVVETVRGMGYRLGASEARA
jgi:two-component system OmpR family response regulator